VFDKKKIKITPTPVENVYGVAFNVQSPICQGHNVQIYVYLNNEIQQLCSVNRHISRKKGIL